MDRTARFVLSETEYELDKNVIKDEERPSYKHKFVMILRRTICVEPPSGVKDNRKHCLIASNNISWVNKSCTSTNACDGDNG